MQVLSESEKLIMSVVWNNPGIKIMDIGKEIKIRFDRNWQPQTVATFITRLKKKGYVKIERREKDRNTYVFASISINDYKREQILEMQNIFFNGNKKEMEKFIKNM